MGRQINFYMGPEDERSFLEAAVAPGAVDLLPGGPSDGEKPELLLKLPDVGAPFGWKVYLVPKDLGNHMVYLRGKGPSQVVIDALRSPVVEFSRSRVHDHAISRGRLWLETQFFSPEGVVMKKPQVLVQLYDRLARYVQRSFFKDGPVYVGPEAQTLLTKGFVRMTD